MFWKGNDRAFSSTVLEPLTKKASRKAREVWFNGTYMGDILAYCVEEKGHKLEN